MFKFSRSSIIYRYIWPSAFPWDQKKIKINNSHCEIKISIFAISGHCCSHVLFSGYFLLRSYSCEAGLIWASLETSEYLTNAVWGSFENFGFVLFFGLGCLFANYSMLNSIYVGLYLQIGFFYDSWKTILWRPSLYSFLSRLWFSIVIVGSY